MEMWGEGAKRKGFPFGHGCSSEENFSQSSQLFSTVSRTRFVYSLRLSLYRFEASTLAGEEVFGSLSRLGRGEESQHGTRSSGDVFRSWWMSKTTRK